MGKFIVVGIKYTKKTIITLWFTEMSNSFRIKTNFKVNANQRSQKNRKWKLFNFLF